MYLLFDTHNSNGGELVSIGRSLDCAMYAEVGLAASLKQDRKSNETEMALAA